MKKVIITSILLAILLCIIVSIKTYTCFNNKFNPIESLSVFFSSITLIIIGLTLFYQFKQYKKQIRISALTALLNSAQEISRRTSSGNKTKEKEELNKEISDNLPRYYKELMNEIDMNK